MIRCNPAVADHCLLSHQPARLHPCFHCYIRRTLLTIFLLRPKPDYPSSAITMASILIRQEAADTDENRDAEILGVCVATLILSTSGLAARFIPKFIRRNLLQVDDYLIIWAYVRLRATVS